MSEKRFHTLIEDVQGVLSLVGNKIGQLSDRFQSHNERLGIIAQYFKDTKVDHARIVTYYHQLIEKLQLISDDITFIVKILKDHYPQPIPEDQGDGYYPIAEATSSIHVEIHAS